MVSFLASTTRSIQFILSLYTVQGVGHNDIREYEMNELVMSYGSEEKYSCSLSNNITTIDNDIKLSEKSADKSICYGILRWFHVSKLFEQSLLQQTSKKFYRS